MTFAICLRTIFRRSSRTNSIRTCPRGDDSTDHRKPGVARRLYMAGEFPALQEDRKIRRRVLQQDRSIRQPVQASQVARSQSFGRNARLDAIQAGGRMARCASQSGGDPPIQVRSLDQSSPELKPAFENFMQKYRLLVRSANTLDPGTGTLFANFMKFLAESKVEQAAAAR